MTEPPAPTGEPAPEPPAPEPQAPEARAPDPPPELRAYELPNARRVVTYGLQLAYQSSSELRRASLYIGVLTLALLGPPLVFGVEFFAHFQISDLVPFTGLVDDPTAAEVNPAAVGPFLALIFAFYAALLGWVAVAIDGQLIGVALLAARAAERAMTLREATTRARQVFWRMIRGSFLAGLLGALVQVVVSAILVAAVGRTDTSGIIVTVIGVILLSPLGYLATGVVIGDVGAIEALKRSVRLARARPRIAVVVALFTLVTAAIQTFALFAGLDLLVRVGTFLHLGANGEVQSLVLVMLGLLAFVMAFGSLNFTIAAIVVAPQVAAFLGLTYYAGGLDRVRGVPPDARPFRWVTRPMLAVIALASVLSVIGLLNLPASIPG